MSKEWYSREVALISAILKQKKPGVSVDNDHKSQSSTSADTGSVARLSIETQNITENLKSLTIDHNNNKESEPAKVDMGIKPAVETVPPPPPTTTSITTTTKQPEPENPPSPNMSLVDFVVNSVYAFSDGSVGELKRLFPALRDVIVSLKDKYQCDDTTVTTIFLTPLIQRTFDVTKLAFQARLTMPERSLRVRWMYHLVYFLSEYDILPILLDLNCDAVFPTEEMMRGESKSGLNDEVILNRNMIVELYILSYMASRTNDFSVELNKENEETLKKVLTKYHRDTRTKLIWENLKNNSARCFRSLGLIGPADKAFESWIKNDEVNFTILKYKASTP
jgi:CRISPR/Cas system-associated endoribonuclease Cas2